MEKKERKQALRSFLALLLTFALTIGMLPLNTVTVWAEDTTEGSTEDGDTTTGENVTGFVVTGDMEWDSNDLPVVSEGANYFKNMDWMELGASYYLWIGTKEGIDKTTAIDIDAENITFQTDGGVTATLEKAENDFVRISFPETGTYTATYNAETVTLEVSDPSVAFYSDADATIGSLLNDWTTRYYKKGSAAVYLKITDEWELTGTPYVIDENEGKIYTDYIEVTETAEDSGIYKIQVKEDAQTTDFQLKVRAQKKEETTWIKEWNVNLRPTGMLVATCDFDWDNDGNATVAENPNYNTSFGDMELNNCFLALGVGGEDGNVTLLDGLSKDNLSLTKDGSAVDDADFEVDGAIVHLTYATTGTYTLTYTNGETSGSIVIDVVLPFAAFYNSDTILEENYIANGGDYEFSADNKTIYFLVKDGYTASDVAFTVNEEEAADYVSIEGDAETDGKCTITVKEDVQEAAFNLTVRHKITAPDGGSWDEERSVNLVDSAEHLMYINTMDDGTLITGEDAGLTSRIDWLEMGEQYIALVYGKPSDTEFTRPSASDLEITTESGEAVSADVASVSKGDYGRIQFTFTKAGTYKLTYQGSSMTLVVSVPREGFFTGPTKSEEAAIGSNGTYEYTGSNETIYFLYDVTTCWGDTISDVTFRVNEGEIENEKFFTVSGGNGCYTITLKKDELLPYDEFVLHAELTMTRDGMTWKEDRGIMVIDNSPCLMANAPEFNEDGKLHVEDGMALGIGWVYVGNNDLWIAYGKRNASKLDEIKLLAAKDFSVTDMDGKDASAFVTVTDTKKDDLIRLTCNKPGEYWLYNEERDARIKLYVDYPEIGFYTQNKKSADLLFENRATFSYSDNTKDFYLLYNYPEENLVNLRYEVTYGETSTSDVSEFLDITAINGGARLTVKDGAPADEFDVCAISEWKNENDFKFELHRWITVSKPALSVTTPIDQAQKVVVPTEGTPLKDIVQVGEGNPNVEDGDEFKLQMDLAPVETDSIPSENLTDKQQKIEEAKTAINKQIEVAPEISGKPADVKAKKFIDITLSYTVTKANGATSDETPITETQKELAITVNIPADLQITPSQDKEINYSVYRYHDGKAEKLKNTVYDLATNLLTFFTDRFSVYAIVAEEVEAEPVVTPPGGGNTGGNIGGGSSIGGGGGSTGGAGTVPEQPADKPEDQPADKPEDQPADKPDDKPADQPADKPADKPVVKKGDVLKSGKTSYKVTETADGRQTVSYVRTTSTAKKLTVPAKVKIDGVTYKVTAIDRNAFKNNKTLKTVEIASGIKEIGTAAFAGCTKLTSVKLPKTITVIGASAFKDCKNLTSIVIPKSVKSIGKNAFANDKNLKTVTIQSVKLNAIGKSAFKGIYKKAVIKVPKAKKKAYTKLIQKSGYKGTVK